MRKTLTFSLSPALLALLCFAPRNAFAQDPPSEPLPPLPATEAAPSSPSPSAAAQSDTSVRTAGAVRANHVDTVVVAEPGSQVTVHHDSSSEHHEYAPDPGRKAAMIASPIVFGVGAAVAGIAYLTARGQTNCNYATVQTNNGSFNQTVNCTSGDTAPPLVMYDVIVGAVPSAPRWVVGDVGGALVPITLGIVDLATTPHREDLAPAKPSTEEGRVIRPRITGVTPVALTDAEHRVNGGALTMSASF
jgi:hypothetical protein